VRALRDGLVVVTDVSVLVLPLTVEPLLVLL